MNAQKIQIKYYLQPSGLELDEVVPVFHRWIRDHALPELVIDVADYQHVFQGPGVVLIGDGTDYFLDQGEGRLGLLYSRKRHAPAPDARFEDAFRRTLNALQLLEAEPSFKHPARFVTDEILVRFPDRLLTPNEPGVFLELKAQLEAFLSRLYPSSALSITHIDDAKGPLSVRVRTEQAPAVTELLDRLGGKPTA